MSYKLLGRGLLIHADKFDEVSEVEAIIFDIDGTLIDVRKSYDLTIKLTTCIILNELYGIECKLGNDVDEVIRSIKMLGGFNNDWNTSSIIIQVIFLHATHAGRCEKTLGKIDVENYLSRVVEGESAPEYVRESIKWLNEIIRGHFGKYLEKKDLESFLDREAEKIGRKEALKDLRSSLGPLTSYRSGLLTTLFDEIYLGDDGIRERYGLDPLYVSWRGAVLNEELFIEEETLRELSELVPRGLAIVSGRGRWESEKSLEPVLAYFDLESSVFIGNVIRGPEKPDPTGLIECARRMGAGKVLYVGNSAEDLIMVRRASERGLDAMFAGVLTNEYSLNFFIENGAEILMENINDLPRALKREEKLWKPF
ncbi:MAG: hypothetical protein NZ918_05205 [Aigarchaeota archaeon]|nr:hypothetical protein [Aigarchaeota archaeon]